MSGGAVPALPGSARQEPTPARRSSAGSSKQAATNDPKCGSVGPSVGRPGIDTLEFGKGVAADGSLQWEARHDIWVRLSSGDAVPLDVGCGLGVFPMPRVPGPNGYPVVSELWKKFFQAGIDEGLFIKSATKPYVPGAAAREGHSYVGVNGKLTVIADQPSQFMDENGQVFRKRKAVADKYKGVEWTQVTRKDKNGRMVTRNQLKSEYRTPAGRKSLRLIRRSLALNFGCPTGKQSVIRDDGRITRCSFKPAALLDHSKAATLSKDEIYKLNKETLANKKIYAAEQKAQLEAKQRYVAA